jgi:hypothetical protein
MTARALFAGPGAVRAMRPGRAGVVELVLSGGAYVRFGDDWLALASPDAPFGPLSVAVAGLRIASLRPGEPVLVEPGRLVVGEEVVEIERTRERQPAPETAPGPVPEIAQGNAGAAVRLDAIAEAAAAALAAAPRPPSELAPGLRALRVGRLREGVLELAGRGDGLTPAGDDALAGYAAWRHAEGAPMDVSSLADGRCSPLGHAYLRCAERGEVPDAGAAVLAAVWAGDEETSASVAPGLRGWGASSGAALLWGLAAGAMSTDPIPSDRRQVCFTTRTPLTPRKVLGFRLAAV